MNTRSPQAQTVVSVLDDLASRHPTPWRLDCSTPIPQMIDARGFRIFAHPSDGEAIQLALVAWANSRHPPATAESAAQVVRQLLRGEIRSCPRERDLRTVLTFLEGLPPGTKAPRPEWPHDTLGGCR